jgi:anti-anti-sigma factor
MELRLRNETKVSDRHHRQPPKIQSESHFVSHNMAAPLSIIKPAGVIDGIQANQLRHQVGELLASGNNFVMLDLADVNFIDSSGLSAMIIALKMLRIAGGDLYLCSIAEPVQNLLKMTRMDRLFENLDPLSQLIDFRKPEVVTEKLLK